MFNLEPYFFKPKTRSKVNLKILCFKIFRWTCEYMRQLYLDENQILQT